jgi:prepilin-type N-terminal cleavage/methylation domain-containing protein
MNFFLSQENKGGFSLIETLVAVAIFTIISVGAYGGFVQIMQGVQVLKVKNAANNLANEQIEIVRNLPYVDVGIVNGIPAGKIPREQTLTNGGIEFTVTASIRDIDDHFDGQIGETPNDLSPADYKLVEFNIVCSSCAYPEELNYYTRVASLALETQGNNGALFVRVFDASGNPIEGADVNIVNNQQDPIINIDEVTDNMGMFQIVDAPTGTEAYQIVATKDDYSTDRTYTVGDPENPIPDRAHSNVVTGEVTQVSFYIDKFSNLEVNTLRNTCQEIPNVDFNLLGSKTIGYETYKTSIDSQTNSSGNVSLNDLEWDSYNFTITDSGWDLVGSSPVLPLDLIPDSDQAIDLILTDRDPNALQISVVDSETGLPISDASVKLFDGSNEEELITDLGAIIQTDWSGGFGQEYFADDETRYFADDGDIEVNNPPGDIKLVEFAGSYVSDGELESSIFDLGIESNFGQISWEPISQSTSTGEGNIRFQVATNEIINATTTWDFIGPDGTTYYESSGQELAIEHDGDRYLKYKVFLATADNNFTPVVSNVSFTLMTECSPPGQVLFTDLDSGEYSIEVTHPDYQDFLLDAYVISDSWQSYKVVLIPNG